MPTKIETIPEINESNDELAAGFKALDASSSPAYMSELYRDTEARRNKQAEEEGVELVEGFQPNLTIESLEWSLSIPEPKFGTLDFEFFPYQKALYTEGWHDEEGVVMKCSQVGASAWLIRWAMFWPDTRGRTALYVFPKDRQLSDFSNQRVRPVIQQSLYLRDRVPRSHINNVHQRQIGPGWFNLRGSQTVEGLESVDADALAMDEYDYLVQQNIPNAEKRVSGPLSLGLIRRIGFPTVPGFGIAKKYEDSDQRRWTVKCEHCGEWQDLDFFKNVDQAAHRVVCRKCLKPIDVRQGEWVATFPDRNIPGWHMTRLMVSNAKIAAIIAESKQRSPFAVQNFWNRTLGLPFAPKEGRLSLEAIQRAQRRGGYSQGARDLGYEGVNLVTMGVDVASVRNLHVRISEHINHREKIALFIGEVEGFDDLPSLMRMYRVHMCCVDHLPEGRLARAFSERFPGQVYLTHFVPPGSPVFNVDEEMHQIGVRRTEACDATIQLIRDVRNLLPLDLPEFYEEHMQAPIRFIEKDEMDKVTIGFRSTGPDDFFMAELYDLIATEAFTYKEALEEAQREEITQLDDHVEIERSKLAQADWGEYKYGPGGDEYHPGPGG